MVRTSRGFTLVELLVVISIIALLLGIMLPALGAVRAASRRAACAANLHGIGIGFRVYLDENDDIMPVASAMPSQALVNEPRIVDVLAEHVTMPEAFQCPADTARPFHGTEGSSYQYHTLLGGRRVEKSFLHQKLGDANTPVMYDYEPFHGDAGSPGAANYLFADMHVGDF